MKRWRRALLRESCNGHSGHWVEKGEPLLELHIVGLKRIARRCVQCAGEPVPEALPAVTERPPLTPLSFVRFSADLLPLDVKQRAAGEERAS